MGSSNKTKYNLLRETENMTKFQSAGAYVQFRGIKMVLKGRNEEKESKICVQASDVTSLKSLTLGGFSD